MKLSEMVRLACSIRDERKMEGDPEILVEDAEGYLQDFTVEYVPASFDGFYTSTPDMLRIAAKKGGENGI